MKNILILIAISFQLLAISRIKAQSLSGTVTDSITRQTIPGAVVYFPQLQLGATSDINGKYKISPLPKGTYMVEVQLLGYATFTKSVTLKGDMVLNVPMAITAATSKEVLITALGNVVDAQRAPIPVTIVTHDMLLQQTASNAVDAIALQPGVTEITTGPGVSKPEINGLGYNRVLTLFDGERQEDFQWGDEHGVLVDPYAVYDAEIIRGAASLQYGANATAGVVNFKSEPVPENGTIQGSVLGEYQTNNGLIGNSFDIGGNNNGFTWGIRASQEEAHCYSDPVDGYVWGTAYTQTNVRGVVGLNKQWGYSRLSVSILRRQIEIPDGNRDSASRQFEFDVPQDGQIYPNRSNFLSYNPNISGYQVLEHDEVWWQNSINVGLGRIGADIGFSQSHREEIDTGVIAEENMTVHDIPYSLKYQIAGENSGLKLTTGINGIYEFESNAPEPPAPYIGDFEIPNYTDFDIGGYAILNWDPTNIKNLSLSGGVRYDLRTINGQSMYLGNYATSSQIVVPEGTAGAYQQFPAFNRTFTGASVSLGATYQLPANNYVKLNMARSYRPPSISELTSNELDPANIYRLGDPNLKAEDGYELDLAYGYNGKDINFELDGFVNDIQNFIFDKRTDSVALGAPVYQYQAFNAVISGISAYLNIHPVNLKWIELDNGFTYIYSFILNQTDSTQHVPFTPAPRLTSTVKFKFADKHNSILKGMYIAVGLEHDWAQNNIYSALWNELPSSQYTIYNMGIGTNFVNPKTGRVICSFYINCTNLMNLAYMDHTSREQYFYAYNSAAFPTHSDYGVSPTVVTNASQGIYNMGRNVGFKLLFPIGGHKVSDDELKGASE